MFLSQSPKSGQFNSDFSPEQDYKLLFFMYDFSLVKKMNLKVTIIYKKLKKRPFLEYFMTYIYNLNKML